MWVTNLPRSRQKVNFGVQVVPRRTKTIESVIPMAAVATCLKENKNMFFCSKPAV